MMKIISQLPSFEKEKEYRCYSEGNENLNILLMLQKYHFRLHFQYYIQKIKDIKSNTKLN